MVWKAIDNWVERAVLRVLSPGQQRLLGTGVGVLMAGCWTLAWLHPGTAGQGLFLQLAVLTFFFGMRVGLVWTLPTWAGYAVLIPGSVERVCFALFCAYALLIAGVTVGRFRQARQGQLRLSSSLEMARQVQLSLQPPSRVDWKFARMDSSILTARQLGGDMVCWRPTERGIMVLVGDVMGKGAQAALTAAYVKGLFDVLAPPSAGPDQLLAQLHQQLLQRTAVDSFLAALCIELDKSGHWSICRAGLPGPCLVRASGEIIHVGEAGIMLGVPIDPELVVTQVPHQSGDRLFLASDGLCEEEEMPGCVLNRLRSGADLAQCIEALKQRRTGLETDDQTAVMIEWP